MGVRLTGRSIVFVAALVVGLAPTARGETYSLDVLPAGESLRPGVPFTLVVRGQWPDRLRPQAVDFPARLSDFTVLGVEPTLTEENGVTLYRVELTLSVDAPGLYVVPVLTIVLQDENATAPDDVATSRRLFLEIPEGAVAKAELRPNKPLQTLARDWTWPLALAVALMLAAAAYAIWRRTARPTTVAVVDPYARFQKTIATLRADHDVEVDLTKEPAFALSHAAREYIEARAGVAALELTGAELAAAIARCFGDTTDGAPWRRLVDCCLRLEAVKYRPGGRDDRTVAAWIAEIDREVETAETAMRPDDRGAGE